MLSFQDHYDACKEKVDEYLTHYWSYRSCPRSDAMQKLKESIQYSSLPGGKRFRPVLALLVSDSFGAGPGPVLPFAAAVEMIHSYSLIHDDLPCMDNDDFRRNEPTNHKVFGECMALLAGDALLTESFLMIGEGYNTNPALGLRLVTLVAEAAGFSGMVGGQAMDLHAKEKNKTIQELNLMHSMKTGALIRVAVEGSALILGLPPEVRQKCRDFGAKIGLAFQLKDDLIDSQEQIEKGSFPDILGRQETRKYLEVVTNESAEILRQIGISQGPLLEILQMNLQRGL